jgi:hypothetical protein
MKMKLNTTTTVINNTWQAWLAGREGKGQRYGQYLCSLLLVDDSWPELYYEYDCNAAYTMAMLDVLSAEVV